MLLCFAPMTDGTVLNYVVDVEHAQLTEMLTITMNFYLFLYIYCILVSKPINNLSNKFSEKTGEHIYMAH